MSLFQTVLPHYSFLGGEFVRPLPRSPRNLKLSLSLQKRQMMIGRCDRRDHRTKSRKDDARHDQED